MLSNANTFIGGALARLINNTGYLTTDGGGDGGPTVTVDLASMTVVVSNLVVDSSAVNRDFLIPCYVPVILASNKKAPTTISEIRITIPILSLYRNPVTVAVNGLKAHLDFNEEPLPRYVPPAHHSSKTTSIKSKSPENNKLEPTPYSVAWFVNRLLLFLYRVIATVVFNARVEIADMFVRAGPRVVLRSKLVHLHGYSHDGTDMALMFDADVVDKLETKMKGDDRDKEKDSYDTLVNGSIYARRLCSLSGLWLGSHHHHDHEDGDKDDNMILRTEKLRLELYGSFYDSIGIHATPFETNLTLQSYTDVWTAYSYVSWYYRRVYFAYLLHSDVKAQRTAKERWRYLIRALVRQIREHKALVKAKWIRLIDRASESTDMKKLSSPPPSTMRVATSAPIEFHGFLTGLLELDMSPSGGLVITTHSFIFGDLVATEGSVKLDSQTDYMNIDVSGAVTVNLPREAYTRLYSDVFPPHLTMAYIDMSCFTPDLDKVLHSVFDGVDSGSQRSMRYTMRVSLQEALSVGFPSGSTVVVDELCYSSDYVLDPEGALEASKMNVDVVSVTGTIESQIADLLNMPSTTFLKLPNSNNKDAPKKSLSIYQSEWICGRTSSMLINVPSLDFDAAVPILQDLISVVQLPEPEPSSPRNNTGVSNNSTFKQSPSNVHRQGHARPDVILSECTYEYGDPEKSGTAARRAVGSAELLLSPRQQQDDADTFHVSPTERVLVRGEPGHVVTVRGGAWHLHGDCGMGRTPEDMKFAIYVQSLVTLRFEHITLFSRMPASHYIYLEDGAKMLLGDGVEVCFVGKYIPKTMQNLGFAPPAVEKYTMNVVLGDSSGDLSSGGVRVVLRPDVADVPRTANLSSDEPTALPEAPEMSLTPEYLITNESNPSGNPTLDDASSSYLTPKRVLVVSLCGELVQCGGGETPSVSDLNLALSHLQVSAVGDGGAETTVVHAIPQFDFMMRTAGTEVTYKAKTSDAMDIVLSSSDMKVGLLWYNQFWDVLNKYYEACAVLAATAGPQGDDDDAGTAVVSVAQWKTFLDLNCAAINIVLIDDCASKASRRWPMPLLKLTLSKASSVVQHVKECNGRASILGLDVTVRRHNPVLYTWEPITDSCQLQVIMGLNDGAAYYLVSTPEALQINITPEIMYALTTQLPLWLDPTTINDNIFVPSWGVVHYTVRNHTTMSIGLICGSESVALASFNDAAMAMDELYIDCGSYGIRRIHVCSLEEQVLYLHSTFITVRTTFEMGTRYVTFESCWKIENRTPWPMKIKSGEYAVVLGPRSKPQAVPPHFHPEYPSKCQIEIKPRHVAGYVYTTVRFPCDARSVKCVSLPELNLEDYYFHVVAESSKQSAGTPIQTLCIIPTMCVSNLLPLELKFRVKYHNNSAPCEETTIAPGARGYLHAFDSEKRYAIAVSIPKLPGDAASSTTWAAIDDDNVGLMCAFESAASDQHNSNSAAGHHDLMQEEVVALRVNPSLSLLALVLRLTTEDACKCFRELSIYVPYWLYNATPWNDLRFVQDSRVIPSELYCPTANDWNPFRGKLAVAYAPSTAATAKSKFNFDAIGTEQAITVEGPGRKAYPLIVCISVPSDPRFARTKIVRVVPHMILRSTLNVPVTLHSGRTQSAAVVATIAAGELKQPLVYDSSFGCSNDVLGALTVSLGEGAGRRRSTVVALNKLQISKHRIVSDGDNPQLFQLHVATVDGTIYATFSQPDVAPFALVNNTFERVHLQGEQCVAAPFEKVPWYPLDPNAVTVTVTFPDRGASVPLRLRLSDKEGRSATRKCFRNTGNVVHLHVLLGSSTIIVHVIMRSQAQLRELALRSRLREQQQQHLQLTSFHSPPAGGDSLHFDDDDLADDVPLDPRQHSTTVSPSVHTQHRSSVIRHRNSSSSEAAAAQVAQEEDATLAMSLQLAMSFGVSIVNGDMEVAYITGRDWRARYDTRANGSFDALVVLTHLQIDNCLPMPLYDVVVCPGRVNSASVSHDVGALVEARIEGADAATASGIQKIDNIDLKLSELTVRIEDTFLFKLLDAVWSLMGSNSNNSTTTGGENETATDPRSLVKLTADPPELVTCHSYLFIQALSLKNIVLHVSYVGDSDLHTSNANPILLLFKTVGCTVQQVQDAPLRISSLQLRHVYGVSSEVGSMVTRHISMQALQGIFQVLGALEVIGNPVGFMGNVRDGMTDAVTEVGPRGAQSLGRNLVFGTVGIAKGITNSVGSGFARLTFDDAFLRKRRHARVRKAKGIGEGVAEGAKAFGLSLGQGLTGILTKPIEGAKESGATGFFKGVGKGIVGVVAKPVTGVMDLVVHATEGVQASVVDERTRRVRERVPRVIVNRTLTPYDVVAAQYGQLLSLIAEARYYEDHLENWVETDKFLYLLTDHRMLAVHNDTMQLKYKFRYRYVKKVLLQGERRVEITLSPKKGLATTSNSPWPTLIPITTRSVAQCKAVIEHVHKKRPDVIPHQWVFRDIMSPSEGGETCYYEQMRMVPVQGWSPVGLVDCFGSKLPNPNSLVPPLGCVWTSEWVIDTTWAKVDSDGWTYSVDFDPNSQKHMSSTLLCTCRVRRHVRGYGGGGDVTPSVAEATSGSNALTPTTTNIVMSPSANAYSDNLAQTVRVPRGVTSEIDIADAPPSSSAALRTELYENERFYILGGWKKMMLVMDPPAWCNVRTKERCTRVECSPPPGQRWRGEWAIDMAHHPCDEQGWEYAFEFGSQTFTAAKKKTSMVRRRVWYRLLELNA
eukprot:PhM_4_TR15929/c0_g2_i2/m.54546/K19525/VPS13A_C; vacuolar protein sorting-associated protein 13A/C